MNRRKTHNVTHFNVVFSNNSPVVSQLTGTKFKRCALTFKSFSQKYFITISIHFLVPLSVVASIIRETNFCKFSLPVALISLQRFDLKDLARTLYIRDAAFVRFARESFSNGRIMKCFRNGR